MYERKFGYKKKLIVEPVYKYEIDLEFLDDALSFFVWRSFIETLEGYNSDAALFTRLLILEARRLSDVLSLTLPQLNFEDNTIDYSISSINEPIVAPSFLMEKLKKYIQKTQQERGEKAIVFITSKGRQQTRSRFQQLFKYIRFEGQQLVTPEILRKTWVLAKHNGYSNEEILK